MAGVSAARLRHRVTVKFRKTVEDGWGGSKDEWVGDSQVWCEVTSTTGGARAGYAQGLPYDKVLYTVSMRAATLHGSHIGAGTRLQWRQGPVWRNLHVIAVLPSVKDPALGVAVCEVIREDN